MSQRKMFSSEIPNTHLPQKRKLTCEFYRDAQDAYITLTLSASDNALDWLPTQLGARPARQQDVSQISASPQRCSSHAEQLNPNSSLPRLLSAILDKADPQDLCFERSQIERHGTQENNTPLPIFIMHSSISYRLPKSPWALLFWLTSLLTHIHAQRKIAEKKQSEAEIKSLDDFLNRFFNQLDAFINQTQNFNHQNAVSLLKKIREIEKYQDVLGLKMNSEAEDEQAHDDLSENNDSFETDSHRAKNEAKKMNFHLWLYLCDIKNQLIFHYFHDKIKFKVHPDFSIFHLSETDWNQNIKTLNHAISDLRDSKREKYIPILMQQFIHIHNQIILIGLYENLIGKTAQSGRAFAWNNREVDFFLHLELTIQDDRLHFVNLNNNPGYQRHYAKGKSGYDTFFNEMNDLIQALGLQLTPNSDGHKLFSLSLSSTQKLLKILKKSNVFHHDDESELTLHNVADLEQWITQTQTPQPHQYSSASQNNLLFSNSANSSSSSNSHSSSSSNSSSHSSTEASESQHSLNGNQKKKIHYFFIALNELNNIVLRLGTLYQKLSEEETQFKPGLFQKNEAKLCMLAFAPLAKLVLRTTANANKTISESNNENHIELNQIKINDLIQKSKFIFVKLDEILKLFHPNSTYFTLLSPLKIQLELALENIEDHSKNFPLTKSIVHSEFSTQLHIHITTILTHFKNTNVCALIDRQLDLIKPPQSQTRITIDKIVSELENAKTHSVENPRPDSETSTPEEENGNSGSQYYKKSS